MNDSGPKDNRHLARDLGRVSAEGLERLLRDASEAHHEYEKRNGVDTDWPVFYADFVVHCLMYRNECPFRV